MAKQSICFICIKVSYFNNMNQLPRITQSEFLLQMNDTNREFILPHEEDVFHDQFSSNVERQQNHGRELAEAMGQSSETDHDNAPAEVIVFEQNAVIEIVKRLRHRYRISTVVEYPVDENYLTLGSLCWLNMNDTGTGCFYVVGNVSGYAADSYQGAELLSAGSQIGRKIIGLSQGSILETSINDKPMQIEVVKLEHTAWPLQPQA